MKSNLGMWMPKQKDGLNWKVDFTITAGGETHERTKKFRVRDNAQDFINETKKLVADPRNNATAATFKISKIER